MSNLRLEVKVPKDRRVTVQLPDDIQPGEAEMVVIVRSKTPEKPALAVSRLPVLHVDRWPEGATFSRSELYDEDGR
jgi:hypothetical protein